MVNELGLRQKLEDINEVLIERYLNETDVGVLGGLSGIALFQFYYAKFLDSDELSDIGVKMISHCFDKINDGYSYPTYCSGIAGLGWVIQHLKSKDFIELDCDQLLSPFDDYLFNQMKFDLSQGNYDFLHGALGYAFYFFSRYRETEDFSLKNKYESYILDFLARLEDLSINKGDTLKWEFILKEANGNNGNKRYNLGLSHGITSIINFISRLQKFDKFRAYSDKLLDGSLNYVLEVQSDNPRNLSLFPNWVDEGTTPCYDSRIAWCYGDLGIGLSLMNVGKALNNESLLLHAQRVLTHTTYRKTPEQTQVCDASICHGSYGNALMYQRVYQEFDSELFKSTLDFWIKDGFEKAIHKDGYVGYKQWGGVEKGWTSELGLLEGVSGIGLVILEYLSKEPNLWDECLMIS